MTWGRAVRALVVACGLLLVLTFVAANFVLVDLRLWGLSVQTRLAWVAVVPAGVGFAAGRLFARTRGAARGLGSTHASGFANGPDVTPPEPSPPRP